MVWARWWEQRHGRAEAELTEVSGPELANLELDHNEAVVPLVVEEQVEVEVVAVDVEVDLSSDEREAVTEGEHELDDPIGDRLLDVAFAAFTF